MECRIYGDFFTNDDVNELSAALQGLPFRGEEIKRQLAAVNLSRFFPTAQAEEIEKLLLTDAL